MSIKNAFNGLVDRMFRHADLDEALGMDDLTRLERGLPLPGVTGSMPAPDFGEDGHTLDTGGGSDSETFTADLTAAESGTTAGAVETPEEGWLSKGWTLPEEREESLELSLESVVNQPGAPPSPQTEPASAEQALPSAPPSRLGAPVSLQPPPARDLFTDRETLPENQTFDPDPSEDNEQRPPVRHTEDITVQRTGELPPAVEG